MIPQKQGAKPLFFSALCPCHQQMDDKGIDSLKEGPHRIQEPPVFMAEPSSLNPALLPTREGASLVTNFKILEVFKTSGSFTGGKQYKGEAKRTPLGPT